MNEHGGCGSEVKGGSAMMSGRVAMVRGWMGGPRGGKEDTITSCFAMEAAI